MSETKRVTKDKYYLSIARAVAMRSPCLKAKYGAIIVKDDVILSTGYNGPVRGGVNCEEVGCLKLLRAPEHGRGYEWCLPPDEVVVGNDGAMPIADVRPGDLVLTHEGRYRRVTKTYKREYEGEICIIEPWNLPPVRLTPNHPVLIVRGTRCCYTRWKYCKPTCTWTHRSHCGEPYKGFTPQWVPAGEVREGDFVALPISKEEEEASHLDLSWLESLPEVYRKAIEARKRGAIQVLHILLRTGVIPSLDAAPPSGKRRATIYRLTWKERPHFVKPYVAMGFLFSPVKRVREERYRGVVYNLEVEGDNSYTTASFVVHNCNAVHAEENAIINAARTGAKVLGGVMYVSGFAVRGGEMHESTPCTRCKRAIINAGIKEVVTERSDGTIVKYDVKEWVKEDAELYLRELEKARREAGGAAS